MSVETGPRSAFDPGLAGQFCRLDRPGAPSIPLPVRRWRGDARRSDRWLLHSCLGPTVDLGCGPGRLVAALGELGVPALGVDTSDVAIRLCSQRGAAALRRDVFAPLPGEGRWHHALLADGNIGIGGDPVALLRRVRRLLAPHGSVLVELTRRCDLWRGPARLVSPNGTHSDWFPWAQLGPDALRRVAAEAGLRVHRSRAGRRPCAELAVD